MMSFRGQASSAKLKSLGSKRTALACHPTKGVNKAEELTYLSTNIGCCHKKLADEAGTWPACLIGLPHWPASLACLIGLPHWPASLPCLIGLPHWPASLACLIGLPHWPASLACLPASLACLPASSACLPACLVMLLAILYCLSCFSAN